jgi:hypothetical protein
MRDLLGRTRAWMKCSRSGLHALQSISLSGLQGVTRDKLSVPVSSTCWEDTQSLLNKQPKLSALPMVSGFFFCHK